MFPTFVGRDSVVLSVRVLEGVGHLKGPGAVKAQDEVVEVFLEDSGVRITGDPGHSTNSRIGFNPLRWLVEVPAQVDFDAG